jgi:hypothetical protein
MVVGELGQYFGPGPTRVANQPLIATVVQVHPAFFVDVYPDLRCQPQGFGDWLDGLQATVHRTGEQGRDAVALTHLIPGVTGVGSYPVVGLSGSQMFSQKFGLPLTQVCQRWVYFPVADIRERIVCRLAVANDK